MDPCICLLLCESCCHIAAFAFSSQHLLVFSDPSVYTYFMHNRSQKVAMDVLTEKHETHTKKLSLPQVIAQTYQGSDLMEVAHHLKPHEFIFGFIEQTAREMDLMALLFSNMTENDFFTEMDGKVVNADPTYRFSGKDVAAWLGIQPARVYSTLRTPARHMLTRAIGLDINGEFDYITLFKRCSYKNGVLEIIPNDQLREIYLLKARDSEKTKGHAVINNNVYRTIRSTNAKRLYEMLSRFKYNGAPDSISNAEHRRLFPISLVELKGQFGAYNEDGKFKKPAYKDNTKFIHDVIVRAIKNLCANDEVMEELEFLYSNPDAEHAKRDLGFERIYEGGKVTKIRFCYRWKNTTASTVDMDEQLAFEAIEKYEIARLSRKLHREELKELIYYLELLGMQEEAQPIKDELILLDHPPLDVPDEPLDKLAAMRAKIQKIRNQQQ